MKSDIKYQILSFSKVPTGANFRARGAWYLKLNKTYEKDII